MRGRDVRGVRCYWSPTADGLGTLTLLGDGVTVIADGVTLEQASDLVAPHFVTVGPPPSPSVPTDGARARL